MASTSQVTSARSGFSPLARKPPYIPAALNPSAAVTPPGIYTIIDFKLISAVQTHEIYQQSIYLLQCMWLVIEIIHN